ncbi:MAG: prohibitin family protein [Methanobacteriota archaeon]|nr:MAG: prohibitin family protein [Euryarchaeota archaeon]
MKLFRRNREPESESPRRREGLLRDGDGNTRIGLAVLVIIILLIASLVVTAASFRNVPAGHKGVILSGPNGPSREEINEGWSLNLAYMASDIRIVRYNVQTRDMIGSQGNSLTIRSSDNLNVHMDLTLVYHFPGDRVADILIQYGDPLEIIDRYLRSVPRDVASNFTGEYIGGIGRIVIEDEIQREVTAALATYSIVVDDILVRDVDLPDTVDIAIEEKLAAQQKVVTAELERQAIVIRAMAEADRIRLEAEGIRNATVLKANGTAAAMRLIIETLKFEDPNLVNATWAYLTVLYIQALSDPNSNISFVIITDGGVPIIIQPKP